LQACTAEDAHALGLGLVDMVFDFGKVRGRDERPHLCRLVEWRADPDAVSKLLEPDEEGVVDGLVNEDPAAGIAVFALVEKDAVGCTGRSQFDVGVLKDNVRGPMQ